MRFQQNAAFGILGLLWSNLALAQEPVEPQPVAPEVGESTAPGGPEAPSAEVGENPVEGLPAAPPAPPLVKTLPPRLANAPGSLWSETDARILIGMDGNARRVGDLITVIIQESTTTEATADTESKRASTVGGGITSFFGLGTSIIGSNSDMESGLSIEASGSADFDGTGTTSRTGTLQGLLTCKVTEVLPNGNLQIWGWKQVRSNRESQYLVLTGTVRPRDIELDNTVQSHLLAEAQIEYTGSGVVSDKQGPGFGTRLLDHAWPF